MERVALRTKQLLGLSARPGEKSEWLIAASLLPFGGLECCMAMPEALGPG